SRRQRIFRCLYFIALLFISKVLCNPKLYACNSSDGCIIVADRSVALLDSICQSFQMHIQFDTEVDVVGLCQKGQFLVVGERSGNLHLLHVPSKQTLLTNVLVQKSANEKTYLNLIIEKDNLQGMIKTAYISTKDYHTLGCLNFVIGDSMNNILLIIGGQGDCVLSKWEVDPSKNLVSVQSFADSSMIKGKTLKKFNILSMWDVYSLTLTWDWPSVHIEEFLLTTESDSSSVIRQGIASLKLITLTVPVNKQVQISFFIYILCFVLLEIYFFVTLVSNNCLLQDTIYFLEGINENHQKSPEGPVSVLVLRSLTEALPENRLRRLLHKHKFTEAENFAIQFGLDVELVYKVKASAILEKLASSSIGSYGQTVWLDLVDEAKENLHKTQDNHFVVDYCINAPWPTYETTQEMLNYAKIRVLRAQARLTTFYGVFGPEKFSGIAWTEFLNNEDLFKNILFQLQEGNLPCAQYLWLRHQADFESSFDVKMLEDLLNIICTTIPVKELCLWLKNVVIPFVRRVVPKGQKILAKWLEQGARNLELTDKANWPENGLQMAEVFFTSKNPGELGLASSCRWIPLKCGDCEEVHRLKKLVNDLQELEDLHKKYKCKLALCDFEKENASTIVFRMFDKVLAPELIPSILEKFVKPYIHEHNLQQDELLLQYIKDLLERCRTRSTSVFETAWEAKAIAVIGCISDTDLIFDAVLQIMHGAVVPWSAAVEQLVKQHLEMKHVKVKLLQESFRLMEMKKLLRGYGMRDTNLLKDKQMIMRLVKYVLKQDTPTSLEDALKIVAAYMLPSVEVYILRMVDLIDQDRGEESLNLLKSLPIAEAEKVAERLSIWARLVLQKEADNSEEHKTQMCITKTLVEVLKFLLSIQKENLLKEDECKANLKMFETLASLQEDFDIFISVKDYGNPLLMSQLLEEHIKAYESIRSMAKSRKVQATNSKDDSKTKNRSTESRLYKLALLLQTTEQELGAKLALRSLDAGKIEEALKICRDLYEHHCNEQTGKLLFLACQKLCHMLGADVPMITPKELNFPAVINEMACQAATICSPDVLLDSLELCKYTLAAKEIYGQCQIENYGFIAKATSFGADKDPYEEWTYDDFFSEDGIVLDPQMALPVAYETISSLVPIADKKMYPLDSVSLANCPFIKGQNLLLPVKTPICALLQNLMECSQCELALHLTVCLFGSCLQHCVSNNMDMCLGEKVWTKPILNFTESKFTKYVIVAAVLALLHKVFNCRLIDHNLALGYCTILPKEDMFEKLWNVINNTRQNYNKILAVALVGAQLASHYGEAGERQKFKELIIDAEWGIQLGKLGISFQTVFRQPSIRKKELIRTLVQNPNVDTDLILKYCRTFMLDSDAALQLCIETLLLQSANANQVEGDSAGDTVKQPHSTLLAKSVKIIPLLKSTKDLVISLSGILHKLDPYDYETIENVLRVIQRADENSTSIQLNQALSLLKHLESYKRTSPPVDLEHQYILEHVISLSPAAQTRLPFHLIFFRTTQCFWSIISAELNEESFPSLLLISKLMKVSLDTLYMSAARHVFEKKLKPKVFELTKAGCSSVINKETTKTVQTIQSYLLSIVNPEWAVAIAHKIAQELPTGPDQIQALKFCLYLAEKWLTNTTTKDESHEKAEVLLKKLRMQYQRSATETVLITHKLSTAEHLKLTGKPANLIALLYEHSSINQRIQNPTNRDYPDIHAAANEIAEINNLDMNKIWDKLLEKWLCPNIPTDEPIGVNQLTFAQRSRALKCLIYLADADTVESLFKKPIEKVKYFLRCFIYLAELETMNIPYTYESFHRSPKEGMIKGLWKNHSHEPRAARLVTELSLEYKVYDPQLWSGLLQKLLGFNMIHYLRKVLIAITGVHSLWQVCKSLRNLLCASVPHLKWYTFLFVNSFVISDLDIIGIARQYAQLDLTAFALGCLLLIPQTEKREQQIQGFLSSCNPETVLQQVDEHMDTGEVAGFASQIRCLILDNIINEKQYERFLKTKYFPLLKLQVMNTHRVKELVDYLVNKSCMDDAAALIVEYQKRCGNPILADRSSCDILKVKGFSYPTYLGLKRKY
uniref:Kinetochore associated 1 n=1 Tax=Chrysemys picta bellii TaxID=8478 RepID=A0A8C3F6L9_CHRPI